MLIAPVLDESKTDFYVSGTGFGLIARNPGKTLLRTKRRRSSEAPSQDQGLSTDFCPGHYPGPVALQMHAYYDDTAGLYMAAYDADGHAKHFRYRAAEKMNALDLTIQHHYNERPGVHFQLPYDTVMGVFHGDWYTAADMYKEWARTQHWCSRKLAERDDVPDWFKEPRPHLMVVSRGGVDRAQATLPCPPSEFPLGRFWPARKLVPIVQRYSAFFESPAVVWLEGWEKIG